MVDEDPGIAEKSAASDNGLLTLDNARRLDVWGAARYGEVVGF